VHEDNSGDNNFWPYVRCVAVSSPKLSKSISIFPLLYCTCTGQLHNQGIIASVAYPFTDGSCGLICITPTLYSLLLNQLPPSH
jgi:hypothetical protein